MEKITNAPITPIRLLPGDLFVLFLCQFFGVSSQFLFHTTKFSQPVTYYLAPLSLLGARYRKPIFLQKTRWHECSWVYQASYDPRASPHLRPPIRWGHRRLTLMIHKVHGITCAISKNVQSTWYHVYDRVCARVCVCVSVLTWFLHYDHTQPHLQAKVLRLRALVKIFGFMCFLWGRLL